jgi:hypothetical protein
MKLLLHVCCGPCSTQVIEELKKDYDVTALFYNPNIFPKEEYLKRLDAAIVVARETKVPLVEGEYEGKKWQDFVAGYEKEKEGGKRCELCYKFRLAKTAQLAKGFDCFTTTMTISPHKSAETINEIGNSVAKNYGVKFLKKDFKNGFAKSIRFSKEMKLYRQGYCGCEYSIRHS